MLQIRIEHAGSGRIPAALGKAFDFHHPNRTVQGNGDHIAELDAVARGLLPLAIDADLSAFDQRSGTGTGFDDPGMPQPFIETLSIQSSTQTRTFSALLLAAQLLLERSEFGERRIRIDRSVAITRRSA